MRCLPAFLSIASRCSRYFQIYDSLRLSVPSNFYLRFYSCNCDVMIIVMWDSRQLSQDQFQWKPENLPRNRAVERFPHSSSEHLTPSYYFLVHMTFIESSIEDLSYGHLWINNCVFILDNCWKYPGHLLLKICWGYLYTYQRCPSTLYLLKVSKYINICSYWSLAALCSMSRGL